MTWQTITHTTPIVANVSTFWGDHVLGGLTHYDGGWYWLISIDGYRGHTPGLQSPVAFFPGYPLAIRYLGNLIGDNFIAGIVITSVSGLGVAVLFWQWCRERMDAVAAACALLTLLFYPYGYYLYGVMYADTMFVFFTLLAFWAVERDRPLLAGLAGAAATFTRPVGIAVVVGLVVRTLERRGALTRPRWFGIPTGVRWSAVKPKDGFVVLSIAGLAAYSGFLWHKWGDPFLFSAVEKYWDQPAGPETWAKIHFLKQMRFEYHSLFTWGLLVQGTLAILALTTVPRVARRFGWGYASYLLVVLVVPLLGSKDFQGLGRYGIAAFPVFAVIGEWLAQRPPAVRRAALACSALLLVLASAGFANGRYIS